MKNCVSSGTTPPLGARAWWFLPGARQQEEGAGELGRWVFLLLTALLQAGDLGLRGVALSLQRGHRVLSVPHQFPVAPERVSASRRAGSPWGVRASVFTKEKQQPAHRARRRNCSTAAGSACSSTAGSRPPTATRGISPPRAAVPKGCKSFWAPLGCNKEWLHSRKPEKKIYYFSL